MGLYERIGELATSERALFLRQFITSPRYLGSITPSSGYLVQTLLSLSNIEQAREIVELGPGTGPFTAGILSRMRPDGRLLCIERDPDLATHLRTRFNDDRLFVVTGDAQDLPEHLRNHEFEQTVQHVVSGLPFTSLPHDVRDIILSSIVNSLSPGGDLLLYQYSTTMRGRVRAHFRTIESIWEFRNLPPAVCMKCTP